MKQTRQKNGENLNIKVVNALLNCWNSSKLSMYLTINVVFVDTPFYLLLTEWRAISWYLPKAFYYICLHLRHSNICSLTCSDKVSLKTIKLKSQTFPKFVCTDCKNNDLYLLVTLMCSELLYLENTKLCKTKQK